MTDPQSQIMTSPKGWVQGYNAHLAVSDDQIVIAVNVVNDRVDVHQFEPMMRSSQSVAHELEAYRPEGVDGQIGVVLADAGYASKSNLTITGPDRLIATGRLHKLPKGEPTDSPSPGAGPIQKMTHRLRTTEGRTRAEPGDTRGPTAAGPGRRPDRGRGRAAPGCLTDR